MKVILETPKLVLREFLELDAPSLKKLNDDKKVIEFTGDKPFKTIKEAEDLIKNTILKKQYEIDGFGRWAVHLKSNGLFIGWCGLRKLDNGEIDLGFRFFKRFWNKGFATEASIACIEYGFETLKLDTIIGRSMPDNLASIRVLEKVGMEYQEDIICEKHKSKKYSITNK